MKPTKPAISQAVLDDLRATGADIRMLNFTEVEVRGIRCQITSAEDAEKRLMVICGSPPGRFPEDIVTACADCGDPIVHRPHAPVKPDKVCATCAYKRLRAAMQSRN